MTTAPEPNMGKDKKKLVKFLKRSKKATAKDSETQGRAHRRSRQQDGEGLSAKLKR